MNEAASDTKAFRALLVAEQARILGTRSSHIDVPELLDNVCAEDEAQLRDDQSVGFHCRSQELKKLQEIGAALERLQAGAFAICQSCEEPMPRRRLLAMPRAEHCVPCQKRLHEGAQRDSEVALAA